jgi:hypothetical protein
MSVKTRIEGMELRQALITRTAISPRFAMSTWQALTRRHSSFLFLHSCAVRHLPATLLLRPTLAVTLSDACCCAVSPVTLSGAVAVPFGTGVVLSRTCCPSLAAPLASSGCCAPGCCALQVILECSSTEPKYPHVRIRSQWPGAMVVAPYSALRYCWRLASVVIAETVDRSCRRACPCMRNLPALICSACDGTAHGSPNELMEHGPACASHYAGAAQSNTV